jgi:hypothetical protein
MSAAKQQKDPENEIAKLRQVAEATEREALLARKKADAAKAGLKAARKAAKHAKKAAKHAAKAAREAQKALDRAGKRLAALKKKSAAKGAHKGRSEKKKVTGKESGKSGSPKQTLQKAAALKKSRPARKRPIESESSSGDTVAPPVAFESQA